MNDPIVNEVRKFRNEHSRQFDYNLSAIVYDYRTKHHKYVAMLAKLKKTANKVSPANR